VAKLFFFDKFYIIILSHSNIIMSSYTSNYIWMGDWWLEWCPNPDTIASSCSFGKWCSSWIIYYKILLGCL